MEIEYNIFSEYNYGLYEDPIVERLDPLTSPFKSHLFVDLFWDNQLTPEDEDFLQD